MPTTALWERLSVLRFGIISPSYCYEGVWVTWIGALCLARRRLLLKTFPLIGHRDQHDGVSDAGKQQQDNQHIHCAHTEHPHYPDITGRERDLANGKHGTCQASILLKRVQGLAHQYPETHSKTNTYHSEPYEV